MGKTKKGFRLGSFRSGDQSEYLAAYALSRVAFVNSIPRQEDIGVFDYLCILSRNEGKHVYPESAFYVQVKSNTNPLELKEAAFNWIYEHMEHPLIFCVVNKKKSEIALYSCAFLWHALFGFWPDERRSITIKYNGTPGQEGERQFDDGKWQYTINLGHPIIQWKIQEWNSHQDRSYAVLQRWITLDAANLAQKRVGRSVAISFKNWQTNESPGEIEGECRYYRGQGGSAVIETAMTPMLKALALNYRGDNLKERESALRTFLDNIGITDHDLKFIDEGGESNDEGDDAGGSSS
jgi:hypothetical protein